jgi:aspartate racemase
MKTIGLIGGMSWESSIEYYRLINEGIKTRLGGLHSAQSLMYSVDFADIEELQRADEWDAAGEILADAARRLERGGADLIVLCTNTMHRVADHIEAATTLPLLHIADPTAERICADGLTRIGLLGTRFTMEQDFYRARLEQRYNLGVIVPEADERTIIHDIIYQELVLGVIREESRRAYQQIIERLAARGAQAVILGCTEIGLLIGAGDSVLPTYDTARLHAQAAVEWAIREG